MDEGEPHRVQSLQLNRPETAIFNVAFVIARNSALLRCKEPNLKILVRVFDIQRSCLVERIIPLPNTLKPAGE